MTGNIRELRNVVERLVILCGEKISGEDVYMFSNPAQRGADPFGVVDDYKTLQDFRDWAEKYLSKENWSKMVGMWPKPHKKSIFNEAIYTTKLKSTASNVVNIAF